MPPSLWGKKKKPLLPRCHRSRGHILSNFIFKWAPCCEHNKNFVNIGFVVKHLAGKLVEGFFWVAWPLIHLLFAKALLVLVTKSMALLQEDCVLVWRLFEARLSHFAFSARWALRVSRVSTVWGVRCPQPRSKQVSLLLCYTETPFTPSRIVIELCLQPFF